MSNGTHHDPLDALLRAARQDEPEPLDDAQTRALVEKAMRASTARRSHRTLMATGTFAALAAAAALVLFLREPTVPDTARPRAEVVAAVRLPAETRAGDRLHGTANAAYALEENAPHARRIVLTHGAVLCDVKPLSQGDSFEVVVDDIHVRVRGTVFSVEHAPTTVRVYEGVVEVEQGDMRVRVYAGQRWARGTGLGELDAHALDALAREATLARRTPTSPGEAVAVTPVDVGASQTPALSNPEAHEAENAVEREEAPAPDAPTPALPTRLVTPSANEAEALLRQGDAAGALTLADAARGRGEGSPRWALVRADALRALGRHADAADAYDHAAQADARHRAEAGYAAASLRFRSLHDAHGALRSLDASGAVSSSLAERALTLRVKLLRAEGRDIEARGDAEQYLTRFPEGGSATFMHTVLGTPGE